MIPQLAHVIEPIARRVLETNEPVVALEIAAGSPSRPDQQRDWLASYYPVRAADGQTLGVGAVIEEVTDRRRAERRSELPHAVAHVLGDAELIGDAIPRVLEIVCEQLGWDAGLYWPVDPERPQLLWVRPARDTGESGLEGSLALEKRMTLAATAVPGRVAQTGRAEWLSALAPEHLARADAEALRSSVVFPISADGAVVGVVELFARETRAEDAEQLASLAALGVQLGQFL
ncbi:MAG: GAF domain-containing protein, partial [Actinobacteria bacterium]|nr:GAF domain-containing protein [Actinomycetota bacterium]